MSHNEIAREVRRFLGENFLYDGNIEEIGDRDSLVSLAVFDSMGVVDMLTFVEQRFGIQVDSTEVNPDNFDNIAAICALVERKLGPVVTES